MACAWLDDRNRIIFLSFSRFELGLLKKQHQWISIWQLGVFILYPFRFDRITCSFGISDFAAVIVALRMSSDRQACDIYTRSLVDCLRNDLTGLIYHKLFLSFLLLFYQRLFEKKTKKKTFSHHQSVDSEKQKERLSSKKYSSIH